MLALANNGFKNNTKEYNKLKAEIADLDIRNEMSRKVDNQKNNNKFESEEAAAAAFLSVQVPNTTTDGLERSGYIIQTNILKVDASGNIVTGKGYEIWRNRAVKGSKDFIGVLSLACIPVFTGGYSMVHTHPTQHSGYRPDEFSGLDGRIGDYTMTQIPLIPATNVYMGNDNSNNVYMLDKNGPVMDPANPSKYLAVTTY